MIMKPKGLRLSIVAKHWFFWLFIITAIAIIMRLLPSLLNAAWGVDFGIYYGLTNSFLDTKLLINSYDGWGGTYQFFPLLYVITGIAHWLTGIEIISLMPKIAPIIGGLTIPIFYLIVYELFKEKKLALFAASFLAVATFHVYQTSHAAPLTIGHFFMMLSFYFLIKFINHSTYFIPLCISTSLLILSHHFTTYFYLISITFIFFAYVYHTKKPHQFYFHFLGYITFASALAFTYWALIATPVYQGFMQGKMYLPPNLTIGLYYLLLFGGFLFILGYNKKGYRLPLVSRIPDISINKKILIGFITIFCIGSIFSFTGIPGVYIRITPLALMYSIPMIMVIGFSYAGLTLINKYQNGFFIYGWLFALILSLCYSLLSANLMPDRHLEYLIIPLCVPAAMTLMSLLQTAKKQDFHLHMKFPHPLHFGRSYNIRNAMIMLFIFILLISNMFTVYPVIDALNTLDERVSKPCINCLDWMQGNVSSESVIVTDHRLSMLLWAEGYNITFGQSNLTWTQNNISYCLDELIALNATHVLIDDIMRERVVNIEVGEYYYLMNASYDKFLKAPFELIYRNASHSANLEEIHWIELYRINQTFLLENKDRSSL